MVEWLLVLQDIKDFTRNHGRNEFAGRFVGVAVPQQTFIGLFRLGWILLAQLIVHHFKQGCTQRNGAWVF